MNRKCSLLTSLCAMLLVIVWPAMATAQADRFELGQRLRAAESAWDAHTETAARARAVEHLKKSVTLFFSLKLSEAGRELDLARFALGSVDAAPADVQWATSLYVKPDSRFIDRKQKELPFSMMEMYQAGSGGIPAGASLRVTLLLDGKPAVKPQSFEIKALPVNGTLKLAALRAEGDYTLRGEVMAGGKALAVTEQTLSISSELESRLAKLKAAVEAMSISTTDTETARNLLGVLSSLSTKQPLETNYPANRMLDDAESLLRSIAAGREFFDAGRKGQYWLSLKITNGSVPARIMIPATAAKGAPLPLVIAMHGAGGSENLFFDGYGRGEVSTLSEQRGWLLVAPRGSSGFTPGRAAEIVDAVDQLFRVDRRRVFIVGHSMGAAQAVATVQQTPAAFAAVAALGGGGNVRKDAAIQDVPFFIGVGSEDFALQNARKLDSSLRDASVKSVRMKEYPGIEHLVIVQEALPEVFRFFDDVAKK